MPATANETKPRPFNLKSVLAPPVTAPAPAGAPENRQVMTSPLTTGVIKPMFSGIIRRGYEPRPPERAINLIRGVRKSGKTSLLLTNPGLCLLDFEGGAHAVQFQHGARVNIVPSDEEIALGKPIGFPATWKNPLEKDRAQAYNMLDPWGRFLYIKQVLLNDATSGNPQFTTVGFDSVDVLANMMISDFCAEKKVDSLGEYRDGSAGWYEIRDRLVRHIMDFKNAGYGVCVVMHLREVVRKVRQGGETLELVECKPWVAPSINSALALIADQIITVEQAIMSIERPTTEVTLADGRVVHRTDPRGPENRVQVVLRTVPGASNPDVGCRVYVEDGMVVSEANAWGDYATAYNEEVQRNKAKLTVVN